MVSTFCSQNGQCLKLNEVLSVLCAGQSHCNRLLNFYKSFNTSSKFVILGVWNECQLERYRVPERIWEVSCVWRTLQGNYFLKPNFLYIIYFFRPLKLSTLRTFLDLRLTCSQLQPQWIKAASVSTSHSNHDSSTVFYIILVILK